MYRIVMISGLPIHGKTVWMVRIKVLSMLREIRICGIRLLFVELDYLINKDIAKGSFTVIEYY
ncbi:hypothetical protein CI610_02913 [invertebrate metagenome]|uniref:Uncharacterized protein n=1 Tax=invertebrate metagenome TaxID=1711999 RepID=A0A2H9T4K8_9ZZZZ